MPELESSLEAFFRDRVQKMGGYTIKLAPTERGIPDRLVIMPGGILALVELKAVGGRLSPIQRVWHTRINERSVPIYVLSGRHEVVEWIRRAVASRDPKSKPIKRPSTKVG